MKLNEEFWTLILAAISIVYISRCLWNLTDSRLWFDEIFSVHAAESLNNNSIEPIKVFVFEDLAAYKFWFASRNETDIQIIKSN